MNAKINRQINTVEYDARSFIINGERELLIGGEFHYFRTPPELWEDRIRKVKFSGANLITTYIPWNWHEQQEGKQKWTEGQDLSRFVELCKKYDIKVILKPGPYCCAELDFGGHPDWLLSKKIPLRVLSDEYLEYVDGWYTSVAEIIKPHLVINGGNVFCLQVENEYDHLMNYGEDPISLEDALKYFDRLTGIMDKNGLDVPKFANEAAFLRGRKGIIDTRTYYPNIPFFSDWAWQFEHFDEKISGAKAGQPDSPTMILELQVGWFGMHGHTMYFPGVELTEAVSKSVLMEGASVLNYYMMVGGTTFPFWGSRGNIWGIEPKGIGLTSSFDFGGSPVQEWGEVRDGRFDFVRAFTMFAADFKELILESDEVIEYRAGARNRTVTIICDDEVKADKSLETNSEKFKLLTKKRGDESLLLIRNISDTAKSVDITDSKNQAVFSDLEMGAYETRILPVNVKLPGSEIVITKATSELLFAYTEGKQKVYGLYGKMGKKGQLSLKDKKAELVYGKAELSLNGHDISYIHDGLIVLKIDKELLLLLDDRLAGKVVKLDAGILIADTYLIKEADEKTGSVSLETKNGSADRCLFIGEGTPDSVVFNGQNLGLTVLEKTCLTEFTLDTPSEVVLDTGWLSDWKVKTDNVECSSDYDDSDWKVMDKLLSLEEMGHLKHGYHWYRGEFELGSQATDTIMKYTGNDNDRQYIYINGQLAWAGICDEEEIEIQHLVKEGTNRIAVLYQNFYHNKSHPHEGDIQKYSGIMKPIVVSSISSGRRTKVRIESFKVREMLTGILEHYTAASYDDSSWQSIPASARYVMSKEKGTLLWFRRKFRYNVKEGWQAYPKITIPHAAKRLFIYVNGHPVAWYEECGPQHEFYLPESYLQKENQLVILLEGPEGYMEEPLLDAFAEVKSGSLKIV